jgi:hypothetical protein
MDGDLLSSLEHARWHVALRTFGNNHATLIGLLVDWWISGGERRWALEMGPAFGYRPRNEGGGGVCDAILGEGETSMGVLEVEGSRHNYTLDKMGKYFAAEYEDLKRLEFGLFLAYSYAFEGRGGERRIVPISLDDLVETAKNVTANYPGKQLAILVLEKVLEPQRSGPRARSEYYWASPTGVIGMLIKGGKEIERRSIMPKKI